jgi:hypothetical protein
MTRSRVLNQAVEVAKGELVVFAQGDIVLSSNWMSEMLSASSKHPSAKVFYGPVVPLFPPETPVGIRRNRFAAAAFADLSVPLGERVCTLALTEQAVYAIAAPLLGVAYNFAVRAGENRIQFCDIADSLETNDAVCEEAELLTRIRRDGGEWVFVSSVKATHHVPLGAVTFLFQFDRAFRAGRMFATGQRLMLAPTTWLDKSMTDAIGQYFEMGMLLNIYYGQMCQLNLDGAHLLARVVYDTICALCWSGDVGLLGNSARKWLGSREDCIPPMARERFYQSLRAG